MWDHYWVNALFNKHTDRADSFLMVCFSGTIGPGIQQSHPSPDGFGAICKTCPVSVAVLTLGTWCPIGLSLAKSLVQVHQILVISQAYLTSGS